MLCFSHLVPLFFLFSRTRGRSHMCGGLKNNINVWRSNNDTLRVTQKHHPCSSNSTHFLKHFFLHHRHYNMSRAVRAPTCLPHHVLNFQQVCHQRMQLPSERASVARHGLFRDIVMDWTRSPTVAPGSTCSRPWRDSGVKRNYAELAATRKRIELIPLGLLDGIRVLPHYKVCGIYLDLMLFGVHYSLNFWRNRMCRWMCLSVSSLFSSIK